MNRTVCALFFTAFTVLAYSAESETATNSTYRSDDIAADRFRAEWDYKEWSGLAPTPDNLSTTLSNANRGDGAPSVFEIVSALKVIRFFDGASDSILSLVRQIAVDDSNPITRGIRQEAIMTLCALSDDPSDLFIARSFLSDLSIPVINKLSAAIFFSKRGELSSYAVLYQAASIENPEYVIRANIPVLIDALTPFDGEVWNEEGDRIDIAAMRQADDSIVSPEP